MVDGVHGLKGHVVRHVVVELKNILDPVTIPHLHVEAYPVKVLVPMKKNAINFVVVVRLLHHTYVCM